MNDVAAVSAPGSRPLAKPQHERYARARSMLMPRLEAARRAGYETMTAGNAAKLDRNRKIADRIAFLTRQDEEILTAKRQRLEEFLWNIHETDRAGLYETAEWPLRDAEGEPILDKDGQQVVIPYSRPRPIADLPDDLRRLVEGITVTESGRVIFKLYSAMQANQELRKLLGIGKGDEVNQGNEFERMSDGELIAELSRQANELGINVTLTYDIPAGHDRAALSDKP